MKYYDGIHFTMSGFCSRTCVRIAGTPAYYGLQFVSRGVIRLRIDRGRMFCLTAPVFFLTCPDHVWQYDSPEREPRDQYWVCFQGEKVRDYRRGGLFAVNLKHPYWRPSDPVGGGERMERLIRLIQSGDDHDLAVFQLESLLFELQHSCHRTPLAQEPEGRSQKEILSLISRIKNEPEKIWDFDRESRNLFLSRTHFNRLFRKYSGRSPLQLVIQFRLASAARLLTSRSLTVGEIAGRTGFENEFYFSRLFKRKYALSPLQYRNEVLLTSRNASRDPAMLKI